MKKSIAALVGRPNVGKSTLFNRLIGERKAIVEDLPGTTRDRLYGEVDWAGHEFIVVDTGGLEPKEAVAARLRRGEEPLALTSAKFLEEMRAQVQIAIEEADVILFLVDAAAGITAGDIDVANILRRSDKPVIVVANKADNEKRRADAVEFYQLGLGEPFPISANHGTGTGDLLDEVVKDFPPMEEEEEDDSIKIAIVGRPNVGKSSLLNAILGQERSIVSDVPGTTRDAIDTHLVWDGINITLIDTAGIRRRGAVIPGIEKFSVIRSMGAIARSDVSLLLIDATQGVTDQDAHIAGYILEEHKSVVVVVNKWDAIEKTSDTMNEYRARVRQELKFLDYVPVLFISAKTHQRVDQVMPTALRVQDQRMLRVPTGELNRLVREAVSQHPPTGKPGQVMRVYYATQADVDPPTFVLFVNDPKSIHFSYQRYLENKIRAEYAFEGTPIRIVFRKREREA